MRYRVISFIISLFCLAAVSRLVELQLVKGDSYRAQSEQRLIKTSPIKAPRGEILDRNGKTMVKNRTGFSVQIHHVTDQSDADKNALILRLMEMVGDEEDAEITDSFPVSDVPYSFLFGEDPEGLVEAEWKKANKILNEIDAAGVIEHFKKHYGVLGYDENQARSIIGVRYEMDRTGFSASTPFTLVDGISELLVTKIKEQNRDFPGVAITTAPIREFAEGNTAAHILGWTGRIYKEEYEELQKLNYSMNDVIGKQGIERYMEGYLKGDDGVSAIEQSLDGKQVKIVEGTPPAAGDNVILTIDLDVQLAAEKALKETIEMVWEQSAREPGGAGRDADCAAVAAVDVKTGEIIALASYPTYDPARFNQDYAKLSADPTAPMLNRAIGGAYEPGSTFKMLTAIAALEEGVVTPSDIIVDQGVYRFYKDYQPACWIYHSTGGTHGSQNVVQAIKNSCNYYFYDIGRRVTIEKMNQYSTALGLGQSTGIELSGEENRGKLAGPEDRRRNNREWMPGDTLQAAIGQSDNLFTPLQLANYMATLVNGGTRYKAHLVQAVRSASTGELIHETRPEILSEIDFKPQNIRAVMEGMRDVVEAGTASGVFSGFNVIAGGKTGTAEAPGGSNNAIFVGFAPFDDPAIAVCAIIEHGAHGTNAGVIAREVLDAYFNSETEPDEVGIKNTLTR